MRSCLKLMTTGFVVGFTLFFGILFFPRDWIKPCDEGGISAWLFLVGGVAGFVSLFTLFNIYV